jgi:hypothetical protein
MSMPSISSRAAEVSRGRRRFRGLLLLFEILALGGIVGRRGLARPFDAVWMDQPQVAHVVAGHPARRAVAKLFVDVLFPQLRRLHDMHVAVDDFESVFSHNSPRLLELYLTGDLSV